SNTYPSGACGNSPSTNDTSVPSGKLTPAETTEPSAGRSNSADPSAHVAVTGNVVPSGNSPASTPESTFRKLNVPSASPGSSDTYVFVTDQAMSSLPSARIVIESADNCEDSNTYPSGACGNSPSTNDTSAPSHKPTPAATTEPSAGRSNSADPSAHVAVTGNVVPSGNSPASTPLSTYRKFNVPSASPFPTRRSSDLTDQAMSSLPSARIVIESADNCEDSNTYPSGACGNSPSTNDT